MEQLVHVAYRTVSSCDIGYCHQFLEEHQIYDVKYNLLTVKTTKFFQILLKYFKNSKIRALSVIKEHVSRSPNPEDEYILKFNANLTIHFKLSTRPTSKNDAKKLSQILCLSFTWDDAKWKWNSNPVSSKISMLPSYFPKDLQAVTFLFVDQSFRFEC